MVNKISVLEAFLALIFLILLKVITYLLFDNYYTTYLSFLFDFLIYTSVFAVLKFRSKIRIDTIKVHGSVYITSVLMGIAIFLLIEIGSYIETFVDGGIQDSNDYFQKKNFLTSDLRTQVISLIIVVPIFEELIFRGLILKSFLDRFSAIKSILLSSFIFWIGHLALINFSEAIVIFILGLLKSWTYFRVRNIYACILIHIGFNASNYLIRYIYYSLDIGAMNDTILLIGIILVCMLLLSLGFLNIKVSN